MPELPEVEIVKRNLSEVLNSQPTLVKIDFFRKDLRFVIPIKKLKSLLGSKVINIRRRAKYIIIETTKGDILSHLGMTGSWRYHQLKKNKHDYIQLKFSNNKTLIYSDPRRFGSFEFLDEQTKVKRLAHLGYEPFDENLTADKLKDLLSNKSCSIKVAIMDQKILVGVGNIYASEALFLSGISPQKMAKRLKLAQLKSLLESIRLVLGRAIEAGGSSISDFKNVDGNSGYFQQQHLVYGRNGESCKECGSAIRMKVIAGRSTFWCPGCQNG